MIDNVGMNVREMGWEGVEWVHLAQYGDQWRFLNTAANLRDPRKAGNFLTSCVTISFSRSTLLCWR
jgi:hypothetical protein